MAPQGALARSCWCLKAVQAACALVLLLMLLHVLVRCVCLSDGHTCVPGLTVVVVETGVHTAHWWSYRVRGAARERITRHWHQQFASTVVGCQSLVPMLVLTRPAVKLTELKCYSLAQQLQSRSLVFINVASCTP